MLQIRAVVDFHTLFTSGVFCTCNPVVLSYLVHPLELVAASNYIWYVHQMVLQLYVGGFIRRTLTVGAALTTILRC